MERQYQEREDYLIFIELLKISSNLAQIKV